jgi:DNA repair exonuclease SbcCD nuclease subunit
MEVLTIGDLHISPKNLRRCEIFLEQLKEVKIAAQIVVILGDVFDSHETIHTSCITLFNEVMLYLQTLPVHTYVLVGNHDMINNTVYISEKDHPFTPYKQWSKVTIVDKPLRVQFKEVSFTFAPYVYRGRFSEMLEKIPKWRYSDAIFAHQEFRGAKMGPFTSVDGDVWEEGWPLVISGHIHDFDELQSNVVYVGAAMQHTFAEHSNKTISVFQFQDGFDEFERISLSVPKKITVKSDVVDATLIGLKEILESSEPDEVRVVVSGTMTEHLKWKRGKVCEALKKKGVKIVFKQSDENEVIEVDNGADLPVFKEILRDLVNKESKGIQVLYKELV